MGIFDKISGRIGDIVDEVRIPEDLHRRHENAVRAIERGDAKDALSILQPTLIERPNVSRTHHLIGRAHVVEKKWQDAIDAYDRALTIRESSRAHLDCALACEANGQIRDAEKHLRRALELEEKPAFAFDIHLSLGRVNLALDRPDRAARELRRALKVMPGDIESAVLLANALMRRNANDDAFQAIKEHIPEPKIDADASTVVGRIHEARGEWKKAQNAFDDALKVTPDHIDALAGAGRIAIHTGALESAQTLLEMALDAAPQARKAEIHTLLGEALEARGKLEDASRAFRSALELNSRLHRASLGLARLELARENPEVAGGYFQSVLGDNEPALVRQALWGLGASRRARGDLAGARHLLDEAQRMQAPIDPGLDARIWADLGHISLESGDAAEAMIAFREARGADPTIDVGPALHEALQTLSFDWSVPDALDGPFQVTSTLRQLVSYLSSDARLGEFLPAAQAMLARMDSPLSLAILGEFNAGKSTIVNAMIGESVLPMGVLPTTAHTGIIRFGPRKAARVNYRDGRTVELSYDDAKTQMKTNTDEIDRLEFIYPHPALRVVEYWDTPGFNAINERHEEIATDALARAEAVLWVMDANQVLSQTEFERIDSLPDGAERLIVVINKIDRLGPPGMRDEAVDELIEYIDDNLDGQIAGRFAISALQAFEGDESARKESGFTDFESFVDERIVQRAGRIKTIEVRRELEAFVTTLDAFQHGFLQRLEQLRDEVDEGIAWVKERTQSLRPEAAVAATSLDETIDFMLVGVEKEIEDALRPGGTILSRPILNEEDREFLLDLLLDRLNTVLEHGLRERLKHVARFETGLAERLDPITRGLSVSDARAMNRRIEGYFDEARTMKALLEERVYGHFRAQARGRVYAAGGVALDTIQSAQDRPAWRIALRRLIPSVDLDHTAELERWLNDYFALAMRFLERVRGDLELLELDVRHRFDMTALMQITQPRDDA